MTSASGLKPNDPPAADKASADFVTMTIADQLFGVPVLEVRDVLGPQRITRVPLAPPEVAGSLNLRGRIVTVIDVRIRLGLPPRPANMPGMSVVVECKGEPGCLLARRCQRNLPPAKNSAHRAGHCASDAHRRERRRMRKAPQTILPGCES
jgi:hypothetical protein